MLLIQMTGLSGAGKSTLANAAHQQLVSLGYKAEIIDGDEYRKYLCSDLGFSKADRIENIRRLGFVGITLARQGIITILSAINPYQEMRQALQQKSPLVRTVHVSCPIEILKKRDVKGLYKRAFLPENHPDRLNNFTGISDPYELPSNPHLTLCTNEETVSASSQRLVRFILNNIHTNSSYPANPPRALFIGRWQPFHNGHKWLIDQKLKQGIPVLVAVRDVPCDEQNPFSTEQTIAMIRRVYVGQPVEVIALPDIESVNYGRGVGYEVNCFSPPFNIGTISATFIREHVRDNNDKWKGHVDQRIHATILNCLAQNHPVEKTVQDDGR